MISGFSHSFDTGIAEVCGLPAAAIYNHLYYWITHNRIKKVNFIKGLTWIYTTYEQITEYLSYLNVRQVKHAIGKLVEQGYIIKENFNKDKFDKRNWYAIGPKCNEISKNLYEGQNCPSMGQICPSDGQICPSHIYIDNKEEIYKEDKNPLNPPSAVASCDEISISNKEIPKAEELPLEVLHVAEKMQAVLFEAKPKYKLKDASSHINLIKTMLKDGRNPDEMLKVFRWCLVPSCFWRKIMFSKKGPFKEFYDRFDQLEEAMQAERRPVKSKNDRFTPEQHAESLESFRTRKKIQ